MSGTEIWWTFYIGMIFVTNFLMALGWYLHDEELHHWSVFMVTFGPFGAIWPLYLYEVIQELRVGADKVES